MAQLWGVDSAARVSASSYQCVVGNFGAPVFWGRYLKTVSGYADGLTRSEADFLHGKGIKILPIYSDFRIATGYDKGRIIARNAVYHAKMLDVPSDVFLFANIEKFFSVDDAWIRGWVETLYPSGYRPGFYHDPVERNFSSAYCKASSAQPLVRTQSVLWSAAPLPGPTTKAEAPTFKPSAPPCASNVWLWQYGKDAAPCSIDTNLMDPRVLQHLW
ncbi:glycoside hydrolase domain-containing protein [Ferviditalea candida]|uniref:Glycoside hydrolase domain-containing protein n=1 Tax=Ferviditalea candida TaxID=3108399 RepID=A0ABU5ZK44_9BACL|nr:glycoside hydrolase domain-containing protein [Paenibacillaceae bacterium T2]